MQWFKLMGNYKPFWNNLSENIPAKHIEDIVKELNKEYNTTWEPIKNKVELKDLNNCALYTDFKSMPNYLKMLNDDGTAFYFYLVDYTQIMGNKNGLNFLAVYELDRYMTIYYGKLQTLLNNRVNVLHLFKYCNRYNFDKEKNAININLLKMPQFNNSLNVFNFNYIRKPLIGFSSEDIYNNNFSYPIPDSIKLYSWNPVVRDTWNCWVKTDFLNKVNKNNRYRYLVAKASALIDNLNYDITWKDAQNIPTFSADAKIIIPIPDKMTLKMGEEPKVPAYMDITNKTLLNAFNAFDIKQTNDLTVSPLGNNFIGSYECDIPYSVWYGLSLREPDKVGFKFGYNKGVPYDEKTNNTNNGRLDTVPIVFFIIDTNYAPRIKLINSTNDTNNTLTNKINHIIKNINQWVPETEPTLLTPLYYKEVYKQDNDASIETNLSYLDLTIDEAYNGFNTYAYLCYDSTLNIAYDYNKNNNDLNSYWNNSNSNLRNDINLNLGVYSSSATNYYNENSTAIITGIKNNQIEADKINADTMHSTIAGITGFFGGLTGSILGFFSGNLSAGASGLYSSINSINNAGNSIYKQRKQLEQNNLNLASNIKNIQTGSSTALINPYIAGSIPNKSINDKTLFNIYSNELTDHNKVKVFNYILNNGYPFNSIAPINDYDNRQYMNVLHVDTSTAGDEILNLLLSKETNFFNNLTYNNAFLGWLNQKHKIYKATHLINVTDFMAPDYVHNVENNLNIINIKDINDVIKGGEPWQITENFYPLNYQSKNDFLTPYTIDFDSWNKSLKDHIKSYNPMLSDAFLNNLVFNYNFSDNNNTVIVSIKSNSILYYGVKVIKGINYIPAMVADLTKINNIKNWFVGIRWPRISYKNEQGYNIPIEDTAPYIVDMATRIKLISMATNDIERLIYSTLEVSTYKLGEVKNTLTIRIRFNDKLCRVYNSLYSNQLYIVRYYSDINPEAPYLLKDVENTVYYFTYNNPNLQHYTYSSENDLNQWFNVITTTKKLYPYLLICDRGTNKYNFKINFEKIFYIEYFKDFFNPNHFNIIDENYKRMLFFNYVLPSDALWDSYSYPYLLINRDALIIHSFNNVFKSLCQKEGNDINPYLYYESGYQEMGVSPVWWYELPKFNDFTDWERYVKELKYWNKYYDKQDKTDIKKLQEK